MTIDSRLSLLTPLYPAGVARAAMMISESSCLPLLMFSRFPLDDAAILTANQTRKRFDPRHSLFPFGWVHEPSEQ